MPQPSWLLLHDYLSCPTTVLLYPPHNYIATQPKPNSPNMAFVNAAPVTSSLNATQSLRRELSTTPLCSSKATPKTSNTTRMGYGDYSYITDKTKGHVNQYYVDKFRNVYDFAKGMPATEEDGNVGRTIKGAIKVPVEGIPQLDESYTSLIPIDPEAIPDPRIDESEGKGYSWDAGYVDPQFLPSTYSDTSSELVAEDAFAKYRSSVSEDRAKALSAMDFGANYRINRLTSGEYLDETYMSSLDGQLDVEYVKLQKLGSPASFNPTGIPQTEIPGYPYLPAVGAMDFIRQEEKEIAFWKTDTPDDSVKFKRPAGNEMPELPYNTPPSVEAMKLAQQARDIIPKEE